MITFADETETVKNVDRPSSYVLRRRLFAVATDVAWDSSYEEDLLKVEQEVLNEKAKGLSDLEVALRLLVDERTVRSIFRRHLARRKSREIDASSLTRLLGPQSG